MESSVKKPARQRITVGDVFSVRVDEDITKYFQYVADDLTQLNSQVIRAFKRQYHANEAVIANEIVRGEIEFFAHVFLRIGLKLHYWIKLGHVPEVGTVNVFFRNSEDSGNPEVKRSEKWYVWNINQPFVDVGKLEGTYQNAEIGVVIPPDSIVHRMRTGEYDFVYPHY
ncbi:MAG TPA: hypothetical protein VNU95_03335 [Candidatus Acidoferrales bacterium]|nr:hypothetical protein [Candidatus Acidoferrales bacterium]